MNVFNRVLRLRPGEAGLVLVIGLVLFSNSLAQQVSEITAISNFLSVGGVNGILVVWVIDSLLILGTTALQSLVIDKFNRIALVGSSMFILSAAFIVLRWLYMAGAPAGVTYAMYYLLGTQQLVVFPVAFWILANDIFDVAQATRLFPLITGFGFVGRLLGIIASLIIPNWMAAIPFLRTEGLLAIQAGLYAATLLIFLAGTRRVKLRQTTKTQESLRESLTEGWAFVREIPAFTYLAVSTIALLVSDVVLEFRFLGVSNEAFSDPGAYQVFYASYRLGLTILSIIIQSLLTSRIISSLTIKNAFLVKPVSTLIGSLWMFVQANLIGAVGGVVLLRISQYTVDEPNRRAFQSLVPEERRGRVSIFMESYLYFVGVVLGCILTGSIVWAGAATGSQHVFYYYLGLSIAASLIAILSTRKLRDVYDTSLLNWRLKRRQRGRSVLDQLEF